ncbi:MFS transporter [Actinoplanes regularis]|uniref:MFS transporter n=1 Tax=Actinoplanes regularis TaxID=52697 RepID=UPI0024A4FEC1|nr:MFS transporter [Actinoplanes regularis]GLW34228.1 ABC transporter permease [Actinoplanes regularis]
MTADPSERVPARLHWLSRDARLIVVTRALRTFAYGCTSVLLAQTLVGDGLSAAHVGVVVATAAAGSVAVSVVMGLFADRFGRRRSLLVASGLMALAGVTFAVSGCMPVLLAAAFFGTISPSTNDNTPFSGIEQAILAETCTARRHAAAYTCYNSAALVAGALGALAASGLSLWCPTRAGAAAFALYAAVALTIGAIFLTLSPLVEAGRHRATGATSDHPRTRIRPGGSIRRLAMLFAVDAFAGGLVVQAMLALWFQFRFGVSAAQLGLLFFAANLLPALAQLTAPFIARRGGLLTAMLVPHAIANILLLCVAAAPSFRIAALTLLARQTLSKIDVPARQAFIAAVVHPTERTAAASLTTVTRSIAVAVSPLATSLLISGPLAAIGAPLLLSGALGLGYDTATWRSFRNARPDPERGADLSTAPASGPG